jgi:hypothetical protein
MTDFSAFNDYGPYFANLAKVKNGEVATIRDHNVPDPGFYRGRNLDKELAGYAYWYEGDASVVSNLRCEKNGELINPELGYRMWPYLGVKPIDQEWYFDFLKTGRWPDVSAAAQDDRAIEKSKDVDPYSIEGLTARLDTLEANAKKLLAAGPPKEKAAADILADVKNTAGKIEKALETGCKAATAPLQVQLAEIKSKWEPVRARAENLKIDVGKVVTLYINAENKRRSEAAAAEESARRRARGSGAPRQHAGGGEQADRGHQGHRRQPRPQDGGPHRVDPQDHRSRSVPEALREHAHHPGGLGQDRCQLRAARSPHGPWP